MNLFSVFFSDIVTMHSSYKRRQSSDNNTVSKKRHKNRYNKESESPEDKRLSSHKQISEQNELSFDWTDYKWELNKLFFQSQDYIEKHTEEYYDFWKFLKKYQGMKREKYIKSMCEKSEKNAAPESPRIKIPFNLRMESYERLQSRLPPIDLEDKYKRLSRKRIEEFHSIIEMYVNFIQKQNFEKLRKLRNSQKALPIREYKQKLLDTLKNNNVVILAGDTGCGKSTQVPQYLMEAGYNSIACTQPRRIACISLSKRVAYETLNEYGSKVGYQIRFERSRTQHTNIVFLTEGLLLRQVVSDTTLSSYNVIILDEIHERHLHTDFLLGVIKCLLVQRKDIKVVLMSATININLFYNYFQGTAPIIQVPGRLFPISLKYCPIPLIEKAEKNSKLDPAPYLRILQLIDHKYPSSERGDLLVFLSGMKEITTVMEAAQIYAQQSKKWIILSLHSSLSITDQEKVFDVAPPGIRKCILSTNIAETSVTIDGIRFVIDSGKVKEMTYDPVCKMQKLKETWISQASAEQRKGRAGRTGPGTCFRLYSEDEYSAFSPYTKPEIQRVPLDSLVLQMMSMGLPSMKLFPFIDPPSADSLQGSIKSLQFHEALTSDETITNVGELLSALPVDISLGKMLIMGSLFHQIEPVLSLAALLSVQTPYTNRAMKDPDCISLNKEFESDHGDPFTLLNVYREWLYIKIQCREDSRKWCRRRGLEEQRFYEMTKLRQQFSQMLSDGGLQCLSVKVSHITGAERARKHGTIQQLRELKKELHKMGPRKTKMLKLSEGFTANDDEDLDVTTKIKDLDFKISYDTKKLREIYDGLNIDSFKETLMLKVIITSGLYPNIAVPDEFNNYKSNSEQVFHTLMKPGVTPHPNGIYACHPEVLQLTQADICEMPGFSLKNPCSSRHQLLIFVSLLETNKAYLVNNLRIPTAQTCLLFANTVDTNVDLSVIVCDKFIELKFADADSAQMLTFRTVQLRLKWQKLLRLKMKASKLEPEEQVDIIMEADIIEKELCTGLIEVFTNEPLYSTRRLLSADVKLLYQGSGIPLKLSNPFSNDEPVQNNEKGGYSLTSFFTYNSLLDLKSDYTVISSIDSMCPYCDEEMHATVLERLCHFRDCLSEKDEKRATDEYAVKSDESLKKYYCEDCNRNIKGSLRDIFQHKKSHRTSSEH